jgi:hypothetical protein
MAVTNLIDTTFTAKNMSTAISVYEYTATGTYSLRFQVRLYQVAGGGDYTINLRLNDGDAQADDPMVPKTTYTAAAGAQNLWFQTINVDVLVGDVINVMVLGLAGDTAVVGSIRIFAEDALAPTTYGLTLDVAATGEAGLDFNNIKAASGATTLTNITVPTVASVTALAAGAIPDNEIDAGSIKADAVTKIAAGVLAVALTESYAADGAAPTLTQAVLAIQQFLQERDVTSTTVTVKKLDGSATAMTLTLNDALSPTAITRAT